MRVRIKICGITRVEDAAQAVDAGADAIGLMFYERSPRFVSLTKAAEIARALPPFVARVGVFVNATPDEVARAVDAAGLTTLQFHGNESPETCAQHGGHRVIKAFRIAARESLSCLPGYRDCGAWLLDSYTPGQLGGTGATFNWDLAVEAAALGVPILLAGGLTPANVGDAIARVRPFAVDVSSGVEDAPGIKSASRIREFAAAVRRAEAPAGGSLA